MKCWHLQITYGIIGIFIGFSIFLSFGFDPRLKNSAASIWGLVSGLFALSFVVSSFIFQKRWTTGHSVHDDYSNNDNIFNNNNNNININKEFGESLLGPNSIPISNIQTQTDLLTEEEIKRRTRIVWCLGMLGFLGVFVSLGGFVSYLAVASVRREKLVVSSHWVTAVWAFMSLKWSITLTVSSYRFWNTHLR